MAFRAPRLHNIVTTLPVKSWPYRTSLILLIFLCTGLMIASRLNNPSITGLRMGFAEFGMSVSETLTSPVRVVQSGAEWVQSWVNLRAENIALKNDAIQLMQWQQTAKELQAENLALKNLLNVTPKSDQHYLAARLVSDVGGLYVNSALLNAGSDNGVKKDQAVTNAEGLLGRIIEVSATHSRMLMLTDINFRLPVMGESTHDKAILAGDNTELPKLSYLSADNQLVAGERIVTSGDGGMFPPGLPVGVVSSVEGNMVRIRPYVNWQKVDFVSIVDFAL